MELSNFVQTLQNFLVLIMTWGTGPSISASLMVLVLVVTLHFSVHPFNRMWRNLGISIRTGIWTGIFWPKGGGDVELALPKTNRKCPWTWTEKGRIVFQPSIFGSELLRVGMSWQMGFVQWLVLGKDIKNYLDTNLKTLVFPMQACQRHQKRDLWNNCSQGLGTT